uniref:Uncharacterized protein n=1 Tax=Rhizophora mucronata TaxID=61149 RepID=A0A2P2IH02_RHIMU
MKQQNRKRMMTGTSIPVDDYQYSEGNTNTVLRTNKRGLRAK